MYECESAMIQIDDAMAAMVMMMMVTVIVVRSRHKLPADLRLTTLV